jgi:PAS domain S-box-containing protein
MLYMDQEILSAIINSSKESILATEHSGEILFCNTSCQVLLNSSSEKLLGDNIFNLLSKDDIKEVKRIFKLLSLEEHNSLTYLASFKNSIDGELLKLELRKLKVKGNLHILCTIARHTRKEEEAHKLYKLLAENAYDINIMFEGEELIYVSPSIKEFLGYDVDEVDSLEMWNGLIHEKDLNAYLSQLKSDRENMVLSGYHTYRQKHKDGGYRWFETKIKREFRKPDRVVETATSVDITQRKDLELELEKQKLFIEHLFDTNPNLIYVRDAAGQMIYCNEAVAELLGRPRKELLSMVENIFPVSNGLVQKYLEIEKKVIVEGEEILIEEEISNSKGVVNHFQTIKKPLKSAAGEVHMLSISTNINKLKNSEKETQKEMKLRNEFFSIMSHEIRTPMNAILGMSELLLRRKPRNDQSKLLQSLQFSSKNLLSIINDILDFSKIESGKMVIEEVNFNIKMLIENVMLSLKPKALDNELNISYKISSVIPEIINGDYIKLSQILNNLLANAIKFTSKGSIELVVGLQKYLTSGYVLQFEIKDTGIGIAKDKIESIFDPFHQANESTTRVYGGTGLGLSIVENLVNIQNGTIEVKSEENVGSVFTVTLPYKVSDKSLPVNSFAISTTAESKWKMNLRVLYVEDVITNQFLIEEIFNDWGINVEMASDGFEALKMIESKIYDLILMDIQMPGIDGLETTRRIRALDDPYFKNVPILALTATTSGSIKKKIVSSGMQDFILKPINVDDLRAKIVEHSSIIDEFMEEEIIDKKAEVEDAETVIIFEQTDKLFLNNLIKYQEFLKMTINEFKNNLDLLTISIKNEDLLQYRQLRHRMKSLIVTFGMKELLKLLNEIKDKLVVGSLTAKEKKQFAKSLKFHVNSLIDSVTNKLASLKWQ